MAQGAAFRINTFTSGNQVHSVITALPNGGFVAAWASTPQDGSGYGVYAQRYNSTGAAVGTEFRVNTTTASDQYEPAITALEDGGFVIVWQSFVTSSWEIAGQRYDANGAAVGSQFQVNSSPSGQQEYPSIAGLENGGYVVVWESPDASSDGVFARIYNSAGTATGLQFQVNTTTNLGQFNATVTALDNGNFVVSWYSNVGGVTARLYDQYGNALTGEIIVGNGTGSAPAVTALEDGAFLITFASDLFEFDGGIVGQVYSAAGTAVGDRFQVNSTTTNTQGYPAVAASGDSALAVWMTLGSDNIYDVAGQLLDSGFVATEQSAQNLKGTMTVADVDAGSGTVTATLSVDHGILNVTAGTSGAIVGGSGTGSVTITGTIAQINALLGTNATSTVQYVADSDAPPASANLTLSVNDGGNSGPGGAQIGSATETIAITAVSDEPAGTDITFSLTEDGSHIFVAADFGYIEGDGDAFTGVVVTTLPVPGTLTLSGTPVIAGQFVSAADIAAGNLVFAPTADQDGSPYSTFTFQVRDLSGATDQSANTVTFDVVAANDAPVNSVPGAQGGNEDTDLVFSSAAGNAIAISDADAGAGQMTVTLSVSNGRLTLGTTAGLTFNVGDGTSDTAMTFGGTVAAINAALNGLTYRGLQDFFGSDTLTVTTNDNQNTGPGAPLSDSDTVAITVAAAPPIEGTASGDTLTGTAGHDVLNGLAGNDTLSGLSGNDSINGGDGIDTASYSTAGSGVDRQLVGHGRAGHRRRRHRHADGHREPHRLRLRGHADRRGRGQHAHRPCRQRRPRRRRRRRHDDRRHRQRQLLREPRPTTW